MRHCRHTSRIAVSVFTATLPLYTACILPGGDDDRGPAAESVSDKAADAERYEAEDRTSERDCRQASKHAGFTGAGFMDYGGNGSSITWNNISAALAGEYELTLRYANGSSGNRRAAVTVNGANAGNVSFASTGGWRNWRTQSLSVRLRAGLNTVTVQANSGSGGPNLDHMDVAVLDLCPDDASKEEPGECGCGTPEGTCGSAQRCATVQEGGTLNLACDGGATITDVRFASYGTPSGSCQQGFAPSSCHASRSEQVVESACVGEQSCTVQARNSVFTDPCAGTRKSLAVVYTCGGGEQGLLRQHFRGEWSSLPDFDRLSPDAEAITDEISVGPYAGTERFGLLFTGSIRIDAPGRYEFEIGSDDGSRLRINGQTVVDNDGLHGFRTRTGSVDLSAGTHALRVEFFERAGGERLRVRYRRAGGNFAELPADMFTHGAGAEPDGCPDDGGKTDPGVCGCGVPDVDSDRDGTADCMDGCPSDADKLAPGQCGCGVPDGTCGGGGSDPGNGVGSAGFTLPVEVLGPEGTRKTIELDVDSPNGITHLYLQCNSCGYRVNTLDANPNRTKATVRINGGNPIALKHYTGAGGVVGNRSIRFVGPEAAYGGIGGGMRTVRFTVPVSGLVRGTNTITFEHRDAAPPSIGFRIVDLNLLRGDNPDNGVFSSADFGLDDPGTWDGPLSASSDIARGRELWNQRNLLHDPGLDMLDGQGDRRGPLDGVMKASCADCHAKDGRDLQYFNFSNYSIIQRSTFHSLSEHQGKQIASYIRSLDIPVVPQARPWNPPYQPGPGLDSRPVYEWAAGAGIDAVLDRDSQMKPYLFPRGTSAGEVERVVDRFDTLNMRELPVALQMPDWNSWLPLIHPSDAFDEGRSVISQNEKGNGVGKPYYLYLYERMLASPTAANFGAMTSKLRSWLSRGSTCYTQNIPPGGTGWRPVNSYVGDALGLESDYVPSSFNQNACAAVRRDIDTVWAFELAKRGLHAWLNVKMWEIMHSNDLETMSANVSRNVCAGGTCIDASEPRGWFAAGTGMTFFSRAPHYIAFNSNHFTDQDPIVGRYEGNVWYHFQLIMDPGYRSTAPSHFAYTIGHTEKLHDESDESQSYRYWSAMIKMRQLQTNGRYGVEAGLDLRTAQPFRYFADRRGNTNVRKDVGTDLWAKLISAFITDLVEDAQHGTQRQWDAANQNRAVQDSDSTDFGYYSDRSKPYKDEKLQGKNTVRVFPEFIALGVSDQALHKLLDWCDSMWPRGPWDSLRSDI